MDSAKTYDSLGKKIENAYYGKKLSYLLTKRSMDIILSILGIVVLSPVCLVAAIAILVEDGRPVFFTQVRIGKDKKEFMMYKFRSMYRNAEELHEKMKKESGQQEVSFKLSDKEDPRVLKVGYYLRKFSIDELPQLINIIKGDMSLVGPRPLPKYEFLDTEKTYGNIYDMRYTVEQGLTCYWQIAGRSDITYERRMEMDCQYAEEASALKDLKLIIKTAFYAVLGKGEY